MTITAPELLDMSKEELDELFRHAEPGSIPVGEGDGTVIFAPDTAAAETAARLAHLIAWKGKVFDPVKGELRNEVGPLGDLAIRAKVYLDTSWFDGRPAIILDYSTTSLVAKWIRDEIREIAPGLYLGIVYWDDSKILNFSLQFDTPGS
jgi:hypothetical protein